MLASGSRGLVPLGSLGEGATLTTAEKIAILRTCVQAVGDRIPVVAGISALSTDEAVQLARSAAESWMRRTDGAAAVCLSRRLGARCAHHVSSVINATPLSCLLYNNPIAYGTDFVPEQVRDLLRAPEPARGEGVERRRAPLHRAPRAARRSAGALRRHGRRAARRDRHGRDAAGSPGSSTRCRMSRCCSSSTPCAGRHRRGAEALRMVPAAAPSRHRAQVRAADQAGAGGGGTRQRARPRAAHVLAGAEREMALAIIRERLASRARRFAA